MDFEVVVNCYMENMHIYLAYPAISFWAGLSDYQYLAGFFRPRVMSPGPLDSLTSSADGCESQGLVPLIGQICKCS